MNAPSDSNRQRKRTWAVSEARNQGNLRTRQTIFQGFLVLLLSGLPRPDAMAHASDTRQTGQPAATGRVVTTITTLDGSLADLTAFGNPTEQDVRELNQRCLRRHPIGFVIGSAK
jgi:hypothetical protein